MRALLDAILDPSGFTPHGFCLLWEPGLIWLHAGSDALISLTYFSIPLALVALLHRRRDMAFSGVFVLFAAFITACGATHALAVLTLWEPAYWLEGGVKLVTAMLSLATAIALWRLLPQAVALPSRAMLADAHARLAAREADLLLHIIDAADPLRNERIAQVDAVLGDLSEALSDLNNSTTGLDATLLRFNDTITRIDELAPRLIGVVERLEVIVERVEKIVGLGEQVMAPWTATENAVRGAVNAVRKSTGL